MSARYLGIYLASSTKFKCSFRKKRLIQQLCTVNNGIFYIAGVNHATRYASQHKSVPVPNQDKLGGLCGRKGIRRNMRGVWGSGYRQFRLEWHPPGLSVPLPPLSSPAPQKSIPGGMVHRET